MFLNFNVNYMMELFEKEGKDFMQNLPFVAFKMVSVEFSQSVATI